MADEEDLCGLSLVVMTQGNEFLVGHGNLLRFGERRIGRASAERCIKAISGNRSKGVDEPNRLVLLYLLML